MLNRIAPTERKRTTKLGGATKADAFYQAFMIDQCLGNLLRKNDDVQHNGRRVNMLHQVTAAILWERGGFSDEAGPAGTFQLSYREITSQLGQAEKALAAGGTLKTTNRWHPNQYREALTKTYDMLKEIADGGDIPRYFRCSVYFWSEKDNSGNYIPQTMNPDNAREYGVELTKVVEKKNDTIGFVKFHELNAEQEDTVRLIIEENLTNPNA